MTKQRQTTEERSDHKNRRTAKPEPAIGSPAEFASPDQAPVGPVMAAGDGSVAAQAGRLMDGRLQGDQRRSLAAEIGQTRGNRHLQRVIGIARTTVAQPAPAVRGNS